MIQNSAKAVVRRPVSPLRASVTGIALLVVSAAAHYQTVTVPTGRAPVDIVVNQTSNLVYAANAGSRTLTVIDGRTNMVSATVQLAFEPAALACNQVSNRVYCRSADSPHLTVIDCGRDNQVSHIYLGATGGCSAFGINTVNGDIYCAGRDRVRVVDDIANEVVAEIPVPPNHYRDLVFSPASNRIYCAGDSGEGVTVIDCAKNVVIAGVPTGVRHHSLCFDARGARVFGAGPGGVSVIDEALNRVAFTTPLGRSLGGALCYDPGGNRVVCPEGGRSGRVTLINCGTNDTSSFRAGKCPFRAAADPIHNRVYVLNRQSNDVTILDGTTQKLSRVMTGELPVAIDLNPKTGQAYVANRNSNSVTVITEKSMLADVRIVGISWKSKAGRFGGEAVTPVVALRSSAPTPSGITVRLEISGVPDPKSEFRPPVYLDSVVVWELIERTRVDVNFPEFTAEPGRYEVTARITDFADVTPADNAMKVLWKFAPPSGASGKQY
jgi:YVTN family beta-propeller protein